MRIAWRKPNKGWRVPVKPDVAEAAEDKAPPMDVELVLRSKGALVVTADVRALGPAPRFFLAGGVLLARGRDGRSWPLARVSVDDPARVRATLRNGVLDLVVLS